MKRIWKFTRAVVHHWGRVSTGGAIIGAVTTWQNTGHTLARWVGGIIGAGALFSAFFKAWNEQYERAESLESKKQASEGGLIITPPTPEMERLFAELEDNGTKSKLTLEVVRAEPTLIVHDNFGSFEEGTDGFAAVVMSFKNRLAEPGQQNESFKRVTANLTFVSRDRTEHIDYGNWFNEYTRYVDFRPGETHTLVIAMNDPDTEEVVGLFNQKTTDPRKTRFRTGRTICGPEKRDLPEPPCTVTITLISQGTTVFTDVYKLEWNEDEFGFSRKQETTESK